MDKFYIIFILSITCCNVIADECTSLKRELANAQKDFITCVTKNSIPVKVCTQCIDRYKTMEDFYNKIKNICHDDYFDKDRLNVIQNVQESVSKIWVKADCDGCIEPNENNTETFPIKLDNFMDCYNKQPHEKVCIECLMVYTALNNFYTSLYKKNDGNICFDWQDEMNRTRHIWGKELKCSQHKQNGYIFIVMATTVTFVVVGFYLTAYKMTIYQERNDSQVLLDRPLDRTSYVRSTAASSDPSDDANIASTSKYNRIVHSTVESSDDSSSVEDNMIIT